MYFSISDIYVYLTSTTKITFFIYFVLVITPNSRVMKSCIMSLHFFPSLLMTFSRYPLSFILYPVSYILYPISCILYPYHVSCILYPVSSILYPVSCILYPVSCIMYPVICTLCAIYCILYHTHKPCTHSCMPSPLAPDPIRVQSCLCCSLYWTNNMAVTSIFLSISLSYQSYESFNRRYQ